MRHSASTDGFTCTAPKRAHAYRACHVNRKCNGRGRDRRGIFLRYTNLESLRRNGVGGRHEGQTFCSKRGRNAIIAFISDQTAVSIPIFVTVVTENLAIANNIGLDVLDLLRMPVTLGIS